MIETSSAISLGTNLEDGSQVRLSPTGVPLLILGTPAAGYTFALKTIFTRLALRSRELPQEALPPLVFDPTANSRYYKRLARSVGAAWLVAGRKGAYRGESIGADERPEEVVPPQSPAEPLVFSARLSNPVYKADSGTALNELLLAHIQGNAQTYHVLADNLEDLIRHEMAFGLLWWALRHGPERGVLGAAVVNDGTMLSEDPVGKKLLSASRRLLLMRTRPRVARAALVASPAAVPSCAGGPVELPVLLSGAAFSGCLSLSLAVLSITVATLLFAASNETAYLHLQLTLFASALGVICPGLLLIFFHPVTMELCTLAVSTEVLS